MIPRQPPVMAVLLLRAGQPVALCTAMEAGLCSFLIFQSLLASVSADSTKKISLLSALKDITHCAFSLLPLQTSWEETKAGLWRSLGPSSCWGSRANPRAVPGKGWDTSPVFRCVHRAVLGQQGLSCSLCSSCVPAFFAGQAEQSLHHQGELGDS